MSWSRWQLARPAVQLSRAALAETLDGGQTFRWHESAPGTWSGQWADCLAKVRVSDSGILEWSAPEELHRHVELALPGYFACSVDFDGACKQLPHSSDEALAHAMSKWQGLRILRQPLEETLLSFLCSSNKQITQIRQICHLLSVRLGPRLFRDTYALPSWKTLHEVSESDLRACKAGYRARYIKETAAFLWKRPTYLSGVSSLPYSQAKRRLMALPGVGEKIADCVLLFGAGKYEAFPVDVWMTKCINRLYGLDERDPKRIAHFGRTRFGSFAGLAQQFLFAAERNRHRVEKPR